MALAMARLCRAAVWYVAGLGALLYVYGAGGPMVPAVGATDSAAGAVQETRVHPQATEFVLNDQYDRTLVYRFPRETISVMFFADYAGSGQLEDWIRPLYDRYQRSIGIYGVADLSVVPGFMRGLISQFFRTRLDYPVMFDWQGTVSRSYEAQSGQANLYLIDTQGRVVLRLVGAVSPPRLQRVMAQIDRLLRLSGD